MSQNTAAPADADVTVNDLGPLAWVLDELRKSLDGATKAMRRFVRDAELARGSDLTELDASHLRIARQQLHQAVGALEMVGMGAPAKVLRAMEALAQKFVQRPELCSDDAANKLERASFALTEYLEGMLKGKVASSVALFPQYRAVMELASGDRVHPADLWSAEWRWNAVEIPSTVKAQAYQPDQRARLDQLVLKVVKSGDAKAASRLCEMCLGFAAHQESGHVRTFWAVAAGFFEAMGYGLLPQDVYSKRTASRLLQQYASLAKGDTEVSDRLAQDLVFFCSLAPAQDNTPALRAVRTAYGFADAAPVDYATEQFGRFDPALLVLARKRIAAAAETWSALAGGDTNRIKAAAEQFAAVAESIVKLHPESESFARALSGAIDVTVRAGTAPPPSIAMEVATSVLYLEAAYEDLDPTNSQMAERGMRLATRLQSVAAGNDQEPLEGWMEELYRRVSDRQTMGSVMEELRTTLGEVEKSLDTFFRTPTDKSPLREVPSQLAQMRGVFSVLGLDQPSLAALRMRSSVEQFLVDEIDVETARTGIFEKLGNSLGAMGFLIDMLSYQRALAKKLFVYDEELGEFKPLMGRERAAAHAAPEPAEPAPVPAMRAASAPAASMFETTVSMGTRTVAMPAVTATAPAAPVPTDEESDAELLEIFLEEAREVARNGLDALDALTSDPSNLADQTTLRRAFHTLKGSSRMVGLHSFGEAAWSFEQLLNTWLAEQRPASDDLIQLSGQAMHAFTRWIDDIANKTGAVWNAQDFRRSSDALRLQQTLVPLAIAPPPEAAAIAIASEATPVDADASAADLDSDMDALMAAVRQSKFADISAQDDAPTQAAVPSGAKAPGEDFASTQVSRGLSPGEATAFNASPDFGSTEFSTQFASTQFASTQLASKLDFDVKPQQNEFANTRHTSSLEAQPSGYPEFESTNSFDFSDTRTDADIAPRADDSVMGDLDFGALAVGESDVMPLSEVVQPLPAPVVEPTSVTDSAPAPIALEFPDIQEQVKVIGTLRLGIPLYNVYLNEADEWSRRLQTELGEWALELHRELPDNAVALAHSLGGSSATVGFSALSELARALEHALQHVQLHRQGTAHHARVFCDAAEDVRRLLHQFAAGFLKDPDAAVMAALQHITETEFPAPTLAGPLQDEVEPLVAPEPEMFVEPDAQETQLPDSFVATLPPAASPMVAVAAPLAVADATDDDIDAVDNLDPDLFPIFEEEATELMPALGTALRQWVARPEQLSARAEVLRVLHTLKGSARLAGAMRMGELSHRLESSIEALGSEGLQAVQLEPLLNRFDYLQSTMDALGQADAGTPVEARLPAAPALAEVPAAPGQVPALSQPVAAPPAAPRLIRPAAAMPAALAAPARSASNQSVRVRSQLLDRLVNQAGEVLISRSRMDSRLNQLRSSLEEMSGNLDRPRQQLRDVELQAESQMQSRLAQTKDTAQAFDPLEFDRFTRVQELTRMMAESVNDVATVQRNLQRSVEGAEDDLISQGRQARELQRDLLRTRMVEFEGISDRLYGVVRQASKDAGKQVKLDIVGGSIDMDRGVLDRMAPAFEHMLRNAVAHGIEDSAARAAAGKPAVGSITIQVNQESNDVSVAFSDDGGGLHLDRIRAKAVANGLIGPDAELTPDQAAELLFTPGFSTADHVTELSGRGIGMDVVRSEVNALGGRIETVSEPGRGTTFKLILPLTTAVTQVVMMRMGEFTIGVPSNLMETVLRVPASVLEQAYATDSFGFGGETIPFYWAGALLQISQRSLETPTKTLPVAVFRSAGQRMALHIDEVLGNREVVVKNLGPQLARLPGLAGMSVLASGAVVLIYNPVALAAVYGEQARLLHRRVPDAAAPGQVDTGPGTVAEQLPLVLVVDDSITVRRVTQRLLKREGYRVALANDGLHALEKLQEETPAVVLSDIEMPRMDGFDLLRNIRADAAFKDLPVIMITSRIAEKHREHARALGADHYLGKPYSEDELLALVRGYTTVPEAS